MYHGSHFISDMPKTVLYYRRQESALDYIWRFKKFFNVRDFEVFLFLGHYAAVQWNMAASSYQVQTIAFGRKSRVGSEQKREKC